MKATFLDHFGDDQVNSHLRREQINKLTNQTSEISVPPLSVLPSKFLRKI